MSAELAARERIFTPSEYLALERAADYRSEYVNGRIYAMSGGTRDHSGIAVNVAGELRTQLKRTPCWVFTSDLKARTTPTGLFSYPDVTVGCGELHFHDDMRDVITNPIVIVEVLSPSTENYDRGMKFDLYQDIAALRDYVLISQDEVRIECRHRNPDGAWTVTVAASLDARIEIASIFCTVELAEVYDKVEFTGL